jgi:hypothetical protein
VVLSGRVTATLEKYRGALMVVGVSQDVLGLDCNLFLLIGLEVLL